MPASPNYRPRDTGIIDERRANQIPTYQGETPNSRKATKSSGHDAVLAAIKASGRTIHITTLSGLEIEGKVTGGDAYTITVDVILDVQGDASPRRTVIYKHAIETFYADGFVKKAG